MKKKLCALLLSASMLSSLAVPAFAVDASETNAPPRQTDGEDVVYLGVENFADSDGDNKDTFKYRFNVNGEEEIYTIAKDEHYSIQNQLMEGYVYDITLDGTEVTSVKLEEGDVAGVLTNVKATSKQIYIDNESFTVNDDAELYDIDAQAGGATVTKITFDELKVDDTVRIVVDSDDHVTKLFRMFIAEDYTAPVSGVPGKLTLKNFLATAMEPVGTSLYVYGGSWDWQDANSSNQSMTIGLPQSWLDFFQSHNADYTYRDDKDPAHSYYWRGYNEYYYGGPDCSGYVGWSVYNLMNTESGSVADGDKGYVMSATSQAKNFAEEQGWGTIDYGEVKKNPDGSIFVEQGDEDTPNKCHRTFQPEDFKTGDIFSMNGHVWICLGKCEDGSLVILHSTPSDSVNNQGGGGVQINGVGESEDCQAVKLAEKYMSKYYPEWYSRYHKVYKNFDDYTTVKDNEIADQPGTFKAPVGGKFSWDLNGTLSDPDGYADMSADEILADLFDTYEGEAVYLGVKGYGDRNTNWDHKPTFQHQFFVDGDVRTFTVNDEKDYSLQNQLMEGYVYDIDVTANEVTSVELKDKGHDDVVMGTVTAKSGSSITVDGQTLDLGSGTEIYEITSEAGGASVEESSVSVGDSVKVMVNGNDAQTIYKTFVAEDYTAPVSGVPGKPTLKNFLATAMEPVGTALYVYGGSWDWQDVNSSNQSMTIGLSQSWIDFFQSQDANYTYKYNADHSESYYPHEQWNQYYYGGIDCSAFVGWSVYNVMHTENSTVADSEGYVMSATKQAKNFATEQNWGTWSQEKPFEPKHFQTGDIFSMNGHVWICLGKCEDGSLVILHSTPSDSINGEGGGGVQINGVGESENCQAVKLAEEYMSKYYPQWWERYHEVYKSFSSYTQYSGDAAGKFSWDLNNTLSDPEGYADMKADAILADLFKDVRYIDASANNGGVISPEGRTNLTSGDSVTYSITPFSGYHISDVTVDGQSVGAVDSYTFDNVTDNHTIAVTFARDSGGNSGGGSDDSDPTYAIRASAGNGGSISPKGTVRVEKGDSKTYTITADKGYAIADVTVNGKSVGAVDSYTFKNVTSDQTIRATFALEGAAEQPGFSDVSKNDWFYDAVQDAVDMGLMAGVSADRFDPKGTVTRAMVAQILYAREGKPTVSGAAAISDVPANAWFHDAMQWAKAQGVIAGYPDGRMEPNAPVTREQLAVILHSYAQKKDMDLSKTAGLAGYADAADVSVWAKDAMSWAVGSGLISGRSASILAPAGSATRAECAVIFTQMFQK